jgi:energy-coupling factor transporter ATP-binding protein EcfA2
MPTLSFDESPKARAVARVKGGHYDGEVLYLHEDTKTGGRKPTIEFNKTKYSKELKSLKPAEKTRAFVKIEEALKSGDDSVVEGKEARELLERVKKDLASTTRIELDDDGIFELLPTPDPKRREVWYIAGQSGSGKSWIAKQLASFYHKLYPQRGIYLISKLEKDETLDALKFLKRIPIQSFIDDYPTLEEFKDTMCIFDDYDTLTGDAEKVITKIIDDLAIMGRHENVTILALSHYLTNYKKTRLLLNEATHIVVYPLSTSYHALLYLIKNYVGVDEDDLRRHKKLGSRWLMYSKGFPQYLISQRGAELLHTD